MSEPRLGFELEGLRCGCGQSFSSLLKRQRLSLECTSLQGFRVIVNWHWSHCHGAFVFNAVKFENSCLGAARSLSPTFLIDTSHQLSIWAASRLLLWNLLILSSVCLNTIFGCFRLQLGRGGCASQVGMLVSQVTVSQVSKPA